MYSNRRLSLHKTVWKAESKRGGAKRTLQAPEGIIMVTIAEKIDGQACAHNLNASEQVKDSGSNLRYSEFTDTELQSLRVQMATTPLLVAQTINARDYANLMAVPVGVVPII